MVLTSKNAVYLFTITFLPFFYMKLPTMFLTRTVTLRRISMKDDFYPGYDQFSFMKWRKCQKDIEALT